jgi:hypothetical protein
MVQGSWERWINFSMKWRMSTNVAKNSRILLGGDGVGVKQTLGKSCAGKDTAVVASPGLGERYSLLGDKSRFPGRQNGV